MERGLCSSWWFMQIQLFPCKNIFFLFLTHLKMFTFWMWTEVLRNTSFWLGETNATAATVCLDSEERLFTQAIKNVFHSNVQNAPVIVFRIFHKPHSAKKKWVVYRLALDIYYSASATGKDFLSYQIFFFLNRTAATPRCYSTRFPSSPVPAVSNHLLPPAGPGPVVTRLVPVSKQTGEIPEPEAEAASMGTIENLFISFLWKIAGFPVLGVLPDHTSFPVLILASPSL